jgi:hypothetical protein
MGRGKAAATIMLGQAAVDVLEDAGQAITLRQLFYRLVATGDIAKTDAAYKKLGRVMSNLREDGTVPWEYLADHVRVTIQARTFDGVEGLLTDSTDFYRRNLMRDQDVAIQLWAESDSIGSVVAPIARRFTIPTFIGRGYTSRGYLWSAAEDAVAAQTAHKDVVIFHVGDYDPSGEDIFRDLEETMRLYAFAISEGYTAKAVRAYFTRLGSMAPGETDWLRFERLALTPTQIAAYRLPSRPAKSSDSRTAKFTGTGTVEVEALPIDTLLEIVTDAIESEIDPEALRIAKVAEASERDIMKRIAGTPVARLLEVAS